MDLTFSIEEEFFVVCEETGAIEPQEHDRFLARARELSGGGITRELLQSQVEIATPICRDFTEARQHLARLRSPLVLVRSGVDQKYAQQPTVEESFGAGDAPKSQRQTTYLMPGRNDPSRRSILRDAESVMIDLRGRAHGAKTDRCCATHT